MVHVFGDAQDDAGALDRLVVDAEPAAARDVELLLGLADGRDLRDLLRMIPNASQAAAPGSLFALRGMAQEGVLIAGNRTSPAVTVMNGLMPRTTNSMWVLGTPLWDLSSVDLALGPQFFHRGPSAAAGLIQLTPQQPEFHESGRMRAEVGGIGTYEAGITHNTVVIPDHLAIRLNLFADGNDGGVTNVANGDDRFASTGRMMMRGQLRWQPCGHESTRLDVMMEGIQMRGNPLGLAGMRPDFGLFDRKVDLNQNEHSVGDHFGMQTHFHDVIDEARRIEAWFAIQATQGNQVSDLDNSSLANWQSKADVTEKRFSAGSILHHEGEGVNWMVGAIADRGDYQLDYYGRGFSMTVDGDPFSTAVRETVDMASLMARGEFRMAPRMVGVWRVTGRRPTPGCQSAIEHIRNGNA